MGCLELLWEDAAYHGHVQHPGDGRGQTVGLLLQQSDWYRIQMQDLVGDLPDEFLNSF